MNETIDDVLAFWFGEKNAPDAVAASRKALWWGKDETVDEEIRERFSELVDAIVEGELDHWRESPGGLLASIICTDQFPRNMYRGKDKAFVHDKLALDLAREAVATAQDEELPPIQRVFVYMPFEHSEDIRMQEKALALFGELEKNVDAEHRELFGGFTEFARRHHEIIERFGRFPHRNEQLGRKSTEEEAAFLEQPGSSF